MPAPLSECHAACLPLPLYASHDREREYCGNVHGELAVVHAEIGMLNGQRTMIAAGKLSE
jgi:hypothetical protein